MIHELKVWPDYFARLADGSKTFEIRKNDRGYQAGDVLRLREYNPKGDHDWCDDPHCTGRRYTGAEMRRRVGFVVSFDTLGLSSGEYVVLSLLPTAGDDTGGGPALPPSAKMLREHANVSETHHPSRGGNTVRWMRHVADILDPQQRGAS